VAPRACVRVSGALVPPNLYTYTRIYTAILSRPKDTDSRRAKRNTAAGSAHNSPNQTPKATHTSLRADYYETIHIRILDSRDSEGLAGDVKIVGQQKQRPEEEIPKGGPIPKHGDTTIILRESEFIHI